MHIASRHKKNITMQTPQINKPEVNQQHIRFSGPSDTFQRRLNRDELIFSEDLKTVLDFYEGLPFKTIFQSKGDRKKIENLLTQRDHAKYSRKNLDYTAASGEFMDDLLEAQFEDLGLSETDRRGVYENTLKDKGLDPKPEATMKELAQLISQFYGHEYDEERQNNYGIGKSSDQAHEDATALIHSGIGLMARSIKFIRNDRDMANIIRRNQLLTNPSEAGFQRAMDEWDNLFDSGGFTTHSVHFGQRTSSYGKIRGSKRKVLGIIALATLWSGYYSSWPVSGFSLQNSYNKYDVLPKLSAALMLNLKHDEIEKEKKKFEGYAKSVTLVEKALSHAVAGGYWFGPGTQALAAITPGLVGMAAEVPLLASIWYKMGGYSKKLYDAVEDYPNVKINGNLVNSDSVESTLSNKGRADLSSQYKKYKNNGYSKADLERFYKSDLSKEQDHIFHTKREDKSRDTSPLFRHIFHLHKEMNPDFKISGLPDISRNALAQQVLRLFGDFDNHDKDSSDTTSKAS